MSFSIGDYVVCPGHGVGQITEIEDKTIASQEKRFYIIQIANTGMKVMVPCDSKNGIRDLSGQEDINEVFVLLNNHEVEIDTSTWNRRYREYMKKVKTGSIIEIADVMRSLYLLKHKKSLSFGEKKLLEECTNLVVREIAVSTGDEEDLIMDSVNDCFTAPKKDV
jgi:CarD family transcriptional regulator